ncbi:MAG TPA: hypothetical protein VJ975_12330 [Candidatus Limnocylindria bacterium]|nr:hypothetical protein [Candidatus Limnocylindria bacterium]
MRRTMTALAAATFVLALSVSTVAAGGPPSLSFYVDGQRYRTIATPTDLSNTGAPDSSFDRIYALGNGLINVAEAKPGDADFNGGRWMVIPVTWSMGVTPVQLTDADTIEAYEQAGMVSFGAPIKYFVCTVNKVPASQR